MKGKSMKKSILCAVILGAALSLCACGADAEETEEREEREKTSNTSISSILEKLVSEKNQDQETSEESTESEEDETQKNGIGSDESFVTVVMETVDDVELTIDDGTVFYTITCSYPVVSIAGNEAAAEKINADIYSRVESFNEWTTQIAETAKEDFEYWLSDGEVDYMPYAYSSDLSFMVTRADDNVISFTENSYDYMGGAHGMPYTAGINYDANTGERIAFTDLSNDPDAFHAETLAYNQELALAEYSLAMFNTDNITDGTLEEVLYADDMWYLTTTGLNFMSPPYALAPYADGTLIFTIPYGYLADMGFKEQYDYTGRMIIRVSEDERYGIDINGDGNDDTIVYFNEWLEGADSGRNTLMHLTINDVDFSETDDIRVRDNLISSWPLLCIYDMYTDDGYVELALIYTDWAQDSVTTSHLFRYTEDGALVYLGQTNSDVSDPSVSVSASDLEGGTE